MSLLLLFLVVLVVVLEVETEGFRPNVRIWIRDWPRTQVSRAVSQSGLLVERKGGVLVGLKQPIGAERLVLVLVVGDRGMRSRVAKASDCNGVGVRAVVRVKGGRRVVSKKKGCIVDEC